jgi:hypothetical protein
MNTPKPKQNDSTSAPENKIVLYTDKQGNVELRADIEKDTMWATLDQIAMLFDRDKSVISRHLKNIFMAQELDKIQLLQKMQQLPLMEKLI